MIPDGDLYDFLEHKAAQYQVSAFVDADPISIPHRYTNREDREVAGFFAATLAWGNRAAILKSLGALMLLMDDAPYDYVMNGSYADDARLHRFVYRTFNGVDALCFVKCLRDVLTRFGTLEKAFADDANGDVHKALGLFRQRFFAGHVPGRSAKHLADVRAGSSGKRLNMFLRWMVRPGPVDFGIWKSFEPSSLYLPLDVHTGNVSRRLGLLTRKQNDWKAVDEVTQRLRTFDAADPVKYDFALFGLGVYEKF
ncbi:MAG: TIGR02757 family protein [Marinilabiliaceae bacterium]|nr:TIGR02757 family protein [Marinilabiliaceae bacterium]